ncbi:MAG TPA: rRNA maturation RNase YbeY [Flavobacteriaceae bacterium]|nr:rRNA maturation RNase YbeY [Flavobacteriaceae bacterium]
MISYASQNDFTLSNEKEISLWIQEVITKEHLELGELSYVFCSDDFLHEMNLEYLEHDTLTDIITFDYREGQVISGEIYISTDRVAENAKEFSVSFEEELHRVMIHGILHISGYDDLSDTEEEQMRAKEDWALALRKF